MKNELEQIPFRKQIISYQQARPHRGLSGKILFQLARQQKPSFILCSDRPELTQSREKDSVAFSAAALIPARRSPAAKTS